ncbi:non-ribosomal peptide synthetase [Longispora sp. K20-0274]|uniref:non-ribosomal peptide synthetase n=1 Tax=Longispora sp. K20-0274 TaxID=3088255 RepID=UPI0039999837
MSVIAGFATASDRYPDAVAVLDDAGPLTYRELALAAGGVAAALGDPTPGGGRTGLLLGHGAPFATGMLGTLAAGRSYVPLDPGYPRDRLAHMLDRADVDTVVAGRAHLDLAADLLGDRPVRLLVAEDVAPAPLVVREADPDAPAYILFTSGSTGLPKAVAQTGRNLARCVANQVAALAVTAGDRVSLLASFSFDAAIPDLYPALLTGATVVPVDLRRHGLARLATLLAERRVTVYHSTPTVYRFLLDSLGPADRLPLIRAVLLGGEEMTRSDVERGLRRFAGDCVFVNGYGATEFTFATHHHVTGPLPDGEQVPIGRPLPGYEVLLRDGEIVVRSPYLAPGYWRDPELTATRFFTDDGVPAYRTGDLGHLLPDGTLVHLGRADRQVKVRGHRVELGEVEAHLAALPGVVRAVAVPRRDPAAGTEIHAYVQAGAVAPSVAELRAGLALRLPEHLLPRWITLLDALPLTESGKVDLLALPDVSTVPRPRSAPLDSESARAVAEVWSVVLGVAVRSPADNFFDLGGTSLLLARVQRDLAARGIGLPMVTLIEHPTVSALAAHLDGRSAGPQLTAVTDRLARRRAARRDRAAT